MLNLTPLAALSLAQAAAPAGPGGGSMIGTILPMVFIFGAMYFFMIAPQQKKQKEHQKRIAALKSGDEVVTTGGIYGTITNVKEDRFVLRISDSTKIEVGKSFISAVVNQDAAPGDEAKK